MQVEEALGKLLLHHECVIVPDLGGFVCNYAPARYDRSSKIFHPPNARISFNPKLTSNDGLLINDLVTSTGKGYETVKQEIQTWVTQLRKQLNDGLKVYVPKVGTISKNKTGKLEFFQDDAVNYLKSAYGLGPIRVAEVAGAQPTKEIIQISSGKERSYGAAWAAVIAVTLMGAFAVSVYQSGFINHIPAEYANVIPALNKQPRTYHHDRYVSGDTLEIKDIVLSSNPEDEFAYLELSPGAGLDPIVVRLKDPAPDLPSNTDNTKVVVKKNVRLKYHVIGGCFSVKGNAKRLVKKLKKEGYAAALLGRHKNLHAVCYGSYATRASAEAALDKVRNNHNDKAWILEKHF